MKALIFRETGEPNVKLQLTDVPTPDLFLARRIVRVLLSPINASDLHMMSRQLSLPRSVGSRGDQLRKVLIVADTDFLSSWRFCLRPRVCRVCQNV